MVSGWSTCVSHTSSMKLALLLLSAGCYVEVSGHAHAEVSEYTPSKDCTEAIDALSDESVYPKMHDFFVDARYPNTEHRGLNNSQSFIETYTKLMPERFDDAEEAADALRAFYTCRNDYPLNDNVKRLLFGQIPMFNNKSFKDEVIRELNEDEEDVKKWYMEFEIPTNSAKREL